MEFTLLWAALTGAGCLWLGTQLWREGLPDHAFDRLVGAAAIGLLVGRLTAMIIQGTSPLLHPGDILIVRGGVNTGAASVGAVVAFLWSVKWKVPYLDAISPSALLGLAGWHAGCLWRGACLGTASDLPWAWALPGSDITRHPVEIYAAALLIAGAFLVAKLPDRVWQRSGAALAAASASRLLTEPLRPTLDGGPVGWYAAGIVLGVVLMAFGERLSRCLVSRAT